MQHSYARWWLALFLVAPLCGSALAAPTSVTPLAGRYIIDDSQGRFQAMTSTAGLLRYFAHDHVFAVRHFNGEVEFNPAANEAPALHITIESASLESVDQLDAKSIETIDREVRQDVLQAAKYPQIGFTSKRVQAEMGGTTNRYAGEIDGDLTLHGATKPARIVGNVTLTDHWLRARGELTIRQTDFNMKPEKLLHNLIRVNDEIRLVFDIAAYQPVRLEGAVIRYYTDRAGFATAVELADENGIPTTVRFAPALGERLMANFPVGADAVLWVRDNPQRARPRWDLIGWNNDAPSRGFQSPYLESDMKWLKAPPWIVAGARPLRVRGRLERVIVGDRGEIAALALSGAVSSGSAPSDILVVVPYEMRLGSMETGASSISLRAGALVEAVGPPLAPRLGAVTIYPVQVAATAIVVDGKSAGMEGFAQKREPSIFPYETFVAPP